MMEQHDQRHIRYHAQRGSRCRGRAESRECGAGPHAGRGENHRHHDHKAATGFVFGAGVYSEHGEYDSLFLSNYIDLYVADTLKRVKGVADVFNFAPRKYSMRLWLDPTRLASRGITATDVVSALASRTCKLPPAQSASRHRSPGRCIRSACAPSAG